MAFSLRSFFGKGGSSDGAAATLTVKKTTKDKNGTSTETITQNFKIDGAQCLISR